MEKIYFDLSHGISENTYHPDGYTVFHNYESYYAHGCRSARIDITLHFATHLDVPYHFIENGKRLDEFKLEHFIGEAVVIDLSDTYGPDVAQREPVTAASLQKHLEDAKLNLKPGDMLVLHTGWHHLYSSKPLHYYKNYCGLSDEAGAWIASQGVKLVAFDTCDADEHHFYEKMPPFLPPNHTKNLLANDILIVENIGGEVDELLNQRVQLYVIPLNICGEHAASSPARVFAKL